MKKILCILLAVIMLFSLAACAGSGSASVSATDTDAVAEKETLGETKASAKTDEITMLTWRSEDAGALDKIVDMFEQEHPEIKVNIDIPTADETEYFNVLKTRLMSSDSKTDILALHPGAMTEELASAGKLLDMTDSDLANLVDPSMLDSAKAADGTVYGIPQTFQAYVIFYNREIFRECGLEEPSTWDGLKKVCSTLREKGYGTISAGFGESWVYDLINNPTFTSYNKDNIKIQYDLEQGNASWHDENVVKVFEDVKAMGENGFFIDGVQGTGYDASIALFAQGGAAMLATGTWSIGSVKEQNPDIDLGFFVMPNSQDYCPMTIALGQCYAINADSKNKEAAETFLNYLYSPEIAAIYCEETSQFSATLGVTTDSEDLNAVTKLLASHDSFPGPNEYPTKSEFNDIVREALSKALAGGDIDEIMTSAEQQIVALREE